MGELVVEPEHAGNRLRVANFSFQHHFNRLWQGEKPFVDYFIGLRLRFPRVQAGGQKNRHGFGDKSGAGIKVENAPPMRSRVSGFFKQLALGGRKLPLARIDAALARTDARRAADQVKEDETRKPLPAGYASEKDAAAPELEPAAATPAASGWMRMPGSRSGARARREAGTEARRGARQCAITCFP